MVSGSLDVAVVGAGPAGLMAAEVVAAAGLRAAVYDHMTSPARKLLMAGRGGLNLTHSEPLERFLARYHPRDPILDAAVRAFPPEALIAWAEGLGIETFTGSSGRVFPKAMKASPLLRARLKRLDELGVTLHSRHRLVDIDASSNPEDEAATQVRLTFALADGTQHRVSARAVVLALGGASWPRLGSDGHWVELLAGKGIAISPLTATNAGLLIRWSDHIRERFAGAPLKRIVLDAAGQRFPGELIVSRTGLEGGPAYAACRLVREAQAGADGAVTVQIDLRPDLDMAELARRLARPRGKQSLANFLRKSAGLSPVAAALLREGVPGHGWDGIAGATPETLAQRIKALRLPVHGLAGLERAISTAGGIARDAVRHDFMLDAMPGVFVAGEMLDWEAPTGGYLLQGCFATAVAAARGVLEHCGVGADAGSALYFRSPEVSRSAPVPAPD